MKISNITNTNINPAKTPTFNGVVIGNKNNAIHNIKNPAVLKKYIEHAEKLENMKIDLKEMIKSWELTPSVIYVLKKFFNTLGEKETHNFTVDFDCLYDNIVNFAEPDTESLSESLKSYYMHLQKSVLGYFVNSHCDKKIHLAGSMKKYENFQLPSEKLILSIVNKVLKDDVERMANAVFERCAQWQRKEELEQIRDSHSDRKTQEKNKYLDYLHRHPEKIFPVSSLVCTLDDIIEYIDKNKEWNDYRQKYYIDNDAFNNPVTKDGESLLMALAHVLPTAENAYKYAKLVDELGHCYIDFNQKDSMGISFIEHVLNSKNRFLLTLVGYHYAKDGLNGPYNTYHGLRYEPILENVFNSIEDQDFKDTVLKLDLFDNMYNLKYKTIFGQPNPKL